MSDPGLPYERSYWVEAGRLLAGEYPGSGNEIYARARLRALLKLGIRTFVDLTERGELPQRARYPELLEEAASDMGLEADHLRFGTEDMTPPTPGEMSRILDAIDASLDEGRPVYVHCLMGIGRTGAVVGCWLVRHGLATAEDVLDRIAELRIGEPSSHIRSPVTRMQRDLVQSWYRGR